MRVVCLTFAESRDIAFGSGEFCFASSDSLVELEVDLVELEVGVVESFKILSRRASSVFLRVPDPIGILSAPRTGSESAA